MGRSLAEPISSAGVKGFEEDRPVRPVRNDDETIRNALRKAQAILAQYVECQSASKFDPRDWSAPLTVDILRDWN